MKTTALSPMNVTLPANLKTKVTEICAAWTDGQNSKINRLWQKDASVWTGADEAKWLDWLNLPAEQMACAKEYETFAQEIKSAGFTDVLLLGMGGSSLCPEVLAVTYGSKPGYPNLHVLDSTDPQQIAHIDKSLDLKKTLFVVSSKSGSTLEPNIFMKYFVQRAKETVGDQYGSHFVAITDPGSKLEGEAKAMNFLKIFHGYPGVGGRYSALSPFGVVPMALIGLDVKAYLELANEMAEATKESSPANPGLKLGAIMGACANEGRDKLTIFTSPKIYDFGAWMEQLVAESTGKIGKAIIPVDQESIGNIDLYGNDRLFVFLKLEGDDNAATDKFLSEAAAKGHPVVIFSLQDKEHLAGEFFRFEIATAVAGSVIGINPFDQPDVEAAKIVARELTDAYEKDGKLPAETPFFTEGQIELFSDSANAKDIESAAKSKDLVGMLKAHIDRLKAGDYFALLGYLFMDHGAIQKSLTEMRMAVRDKKHVATCLGFGPRFLHSTGQAYKGGSNNGVFLQVTADDAKDLAVSDAKYTFSVVKAAQARGDFQVLVDRKRRALRVHIKGDLKTGLAQLQAAVTKALG